MQFSGGVYKRTYVDVDNSKFIHVGSSRNEMARVQRYTNIICMFNAISVALVTRYDIKHKDVGLKASRLTLRDSDR